MKHNHPCIACCGKWSLEMSQPATPATLFTCSSKSAGCCRQFTCRLSHGLQLHAGKSCGEGGKPLVDGRQVLSVHIQPVCKALPLEGLQPLVQLLSAVAEVGIGPAPASHALVRECNLQQAGIGSAPASRVLIRKCSPWSGQAGFCLLPTDWLQTSRTQMQQQVRVEACGTDYETCAAAGRSWMLV